nr:MAG TPA: hypothetical protein [Caudoviricetes sp.]
MEKCNANPIWFIFHVSFPLHLRSILIWGERFLK